MTEHLEAWANGVPCWVDITVTDLERSQEFYSTVFGWEFSESSPEYGGYTNAMLQGRSVAGMAPPMDGSNEQPAWVVYLATDDVAGADRAVVAAGGQQLFAPMEVGDFGHMALWLDPGGSLFGGWQAKDHTGFDVTDEHGTVAWVDLMTGDFDRVKGFFAEAFGFTYDDMGPDYAMFNVPTRPGQPAGGIGKAEEGMTPGWNVCFWVADLNESLATLERAGGRILGDVTDFEFGRFAPVSGPDGEVFVLYNPGEKV